MIKLSDLDRLPQFTGSRYYAEPDCVLVSVTHFGFVPINMLGDHTDDLMSSVSGSPICATQLWVELHKVKELALNKANWSLPDLHVESGINYIRDGHHRYCANQVVIDSSTLDT